MEFILTTVFLKVAPGGVNPGAVEDATEDLSPTTRVAIGLSVTGVGLGLTAVGLMLQKYAISRKRIEAAEEERLLGPPPDDLSWRSWCSGNYFCSIKWLLGMGVFCLGNLLFWFAIALVSQVMLACWQCWAMIVTIFMSPCLLGENVTVWKLGSVLVIIIGIIWVVIASPHTYQQYTTAVFWKAMDDPVFLAISAGVVLAVFVGIGSVFCCNEVDQRIAAVRYILIAAMINWYSVLCAKTSSGFFITSVVHKSDQTQSPEFWVLLAGMLCLAICNVHFLNRALEVGEAVFVVPVYESLAILGQIMFAAIFFDEFDNVPMLQQISIGCAVTVVLLGVIASSVKEPQDHKFLSTVVISPSSMPCAGERGMLHEDDEEVPEIKAKEATPLLGDHRVMKPGSKMKEYN